MNFEHSLRCMELVFFFAREYARSAVAFGGNLRMRAILYVQLRRTEFIDQPG